MYYNYNRLRVQNWMNDPDKVAGMNRRAARYFLEFKEIEREFSRNNTILFFLISRMGMKELSALLGSSRKQKKLVSAVKMTLKDYSVEQKWEPIFRQEIRKLHERTAYVLYIIRENIKLTELYPYFSSVGYDKLMSLSAKRTESDEGDFNELQKDIEEWNAEHQEEIKKHMEDTAEERERMLAHRAVIREQERQEKAARRQKKKEENAEVKEIRANNRRYNARRKQIEKSFAHYYK